MNAKKRRTGKLGTSLEIDESTKNLKRRGGETQHRRGRTAYILVDMKPSFYRLANCLKEDAVKKVNLNSSPIAGLVSKNYDREESWADLPLERTPPLTKSFVTSLTVGTHWGERALQQTASEYMAFQLESDCFSILCSDKRQIQNHPPFFPLRSNLPVPSGDKDTFGPGSNSIRGVFSRQCREVISHVWRNSDIQKPKGES